MPTDHLEGALADAALGDQAGIASLYRALNPVLLRYLRHHVGPVAEDVASEVWLAVAPRLAGFSGTVDQLRALVFTVARRRTVDHYRRRGRQAPTVSFDDEFDCAGATDTEGECVARMTSQRAVETLLRGLTEDQAEIMLLRVLGELDVEQVAEIVGMSAGAVRVAQHRALRRLQHTASKKVVTQ